MAGICLPLGLCKGTVSGVWKKVEIPTGQVSPKCNGTRGNPNLYLDQPITKKQCLTPHWQSYCHQARAVNQSRWCATLVPGAVVSLPLMSSPIFFVRCQIRRWCVHGPLTRHPKLWVTHAPGMPGIFCQPPISKETASYRSQHIITACASRTCRDACRDR